MSVKKTVDQIEVCEMLLQRLKTLGYRTFLVRWGVLDIPVERRWVIETLVQYKDCGVVYEDSGRFLVIKSLC